MDDQTRERHESLQAQLALEQADLDAVLAENFALVAADVDDAVRSPSRTEKRAMRDRIVAAEARVADVQDEIRKIEWADAGVVEGAPQVLGIDNLAEFQRGVPPTEDAV